MNVIFVSIKNADFFSSENFSIFKHSLSFLDKNDKVVFLNSSSEKIDRLDIDNSYEVLNITPLDCDLNLYGAVLNCLRLLESSPIDYVVMLSSENIIFTRNPFDYFKHFKKNIYFYSMSTVDKESFANRINYGNFVKTCNYFMGDEFDTLSIGEHFYAADYNTFKSLVLTLFLNVNRNSAAHIYLKPILSYVYKNLCALYKVSLLDSNFLRKCSSLSAIKDTVGNPVESKKQYVLLLE